MFFGTAVSEWHGTLGPVLATSSGGGDWGDGVFRLLALPDLGFPVGAALVALAVVDLLTLASSAIGLRYIPNDRVGVVEKFWSGKGSIGEGHLIAFHGEAGFQANVLRGGYHLFMWVWQYRIHKVPLVTIPQGKIGYVYARDDHPLDLSQTIGRVVECNHFQDTMAFLGRKMNTECGQRGRQRAILREGVGAINLARFVLLSPSSRSFPRP